MSKFTHRSDVYFHQGESVSPYFVSFPEAGYPLIEETEDGLTERIEGELGEEYEVLVDPGEEVYVGYVKFNPKTGDWAFNRIPPEHVDAEPDGLTYDEEQVGELNTGDHDLTYVFDAVELQDARLVFTDDGLFQLETDPESSRLGGFEGEVLEFSCSCGDTLYTEEQAIEHLREQRQNQ